VRFCYFIDPNVACALTPLRESALEKGGCPWSIWCARRRPGFGQYLTFAMPVQMFAMPVQIQNNPAIPIGDEL